MTLAARRGSRGRTILLIALVTVFALGAWSLFDRREGYYAPVYGPDGTHVYFIHRKVSAIVWGLGYEFFTQPAHVYVLQDRYTLERLNLDSGRAEVLERWPTSPLEHRRLDQYRGRLFLHVRARIGFAPDGGIQHAVELQVPQVPGTVDYWHGRLWKDAATGWVESPGWSEGRPPFSFDPGRVLQGGDWELMTVRGKDALPSAVLAWNHVTGAVRVLRRTREFGSVYPGGVPAAVLSELSQRATIEREESMRTAHERILARLRKEGLSEGEALLKAGKEMQRLGFYPPTPTITARRLAPSDVAAGTEVPVFDIADAEMQSGVFPDIERAIASPGTEVDTGGAYVIHRDYANSARLNAYLGAGHTRFLVRFRGELYELVIQRP